MKAKKLSFALTMCAVGLPCVLVAPPARGQALLQDQPTALAQGCSGQGCWTNYARVTDFDGDGDLDLIGVNCGGFFGTDPEPLVIWKNNGTGSFTDGSAAFGNVVAPIRQLAFGDVDGDGDLDLYIPMAGGATPDRLFVQTAPGVFEDQSADKLPAGLKSDAGFARMGDLDGDGDLDLVVGAAYSSGQAPAKLYFNDGTGKFTPATTTYPQTKHGVNPDDVDLADVDRDFDLDIMINVHNGQNSLWINDGKGNFTEGTAPELDGSTLHYGPVFCDVDGDGDLDALVDNAAPSSFRNEALALNDGSGNFTDATDQISGNDDSDDDNLLACFDFDDDGDFDIVIGSLTSNDRVYENDGTGHFSPVLNAENGPVDATLWMEFGDLNGDGRADLFTAQGESTFLERVYFGTSGVAVDATPPKLIAFENVATSATSPTPVRFAISDNFTTDEGPRVSDVHVKAGDQDIPAHFIGGDLFYATLPPTTLAAFQLCATDAVGNSGCTDFTEQPGGEGGGGPGGGGQGGQGTGAENPSGGSPSQGGSAAQGGQGGGAADGGGDDGCGCSVPPARTGAASALALLAITILARRRRGHR